MKNGIYRVKITETYDTGSFTEGKTYWVYSDGYDEYITDDRKVKWDIEKFSSQFEYTVLR